MSFWEKFLYKTTTICTHPTTMRDHVKKDKKLIYGQRCTQCFKFFPFSAELITPTGVYAKIDKRIEDEQELNALIAKAELYRMEVE